MRPELLAKLRDLVAGGGVILGAPPSKSPSLKNYPVGDRSVREIAGQLWKDCDGKTRTEAGFGKGRVFRNVSLETVFKRLELSPDFASNAPRVLWTHRATAEADIYFLSNQAETATKIAPVFRIVDRVPEFWNAVSTRAWDAAVFESTTNGTRVAIELEPRGSLFVVFRKPLPGLPPAVAVFRGKERLIDLTELPAAVPDPSGGVKNCSNNFTMAGWARPRAGIALPREADEGVFLHLDRNDAIVAVHGQSAFSDPVHSGAGISVGTNGIAVYEHSGNYFAPILVHETPINDWTHVAVVYRDGRPQLYLNGQHVCAGLQSRYKVHSSLSFGEGPGQGFKGEVAGFQEFGTSLPENEIVRLAANRPQEPTTSGLAGVVLSRGPNGNLVAALSEPGPFTIRLADGKELTVAAPELPAPMEVEGDWIVRFPPGRDVPEAITTTTLGSLTDHTNAAVRFFSGSATYSKTIHLSPERLAGGNRVILDLGEVESVAEVAINGRDLGVFWKPPFVVDITPAARAGDNSLEIRITGTWRNRLIGAAKHPKGLPGSENGSAEFEPYTTADLKLSSTSELSPFGLLGPVRVRSVRTVSP
jgi:hypothetical protein